MGKQKRMVSLKLTTGLAFAGFCILILVVYNTIDGIKNRRFDAELNKYTDYLKEVIFVSSYEQLNTGNMDGFQNLAEQSKNFDEVKEFTLLTIDGTVRYSSDSSLVSNVEKLNIQTGQETVIENKEEKSVYYPVVANKSCIDCHSDWQENSVQAVYKIKFDKSNRNAE